MQKRPLRRDFPRENTKTNTLGEASQKQKNDKKEESPEKQLDELLKKSKKILFRCKTQFPFDLFPDEITIDEVKITIDHGSFFRTFDMDTIPLEDIEDVKVSSAIFLSRLEIDLKNEKDAVVIKNLRNEDAMKAKRLLWGIILANEEHIDVSGFEINKLISKLEELGKGEG